MPRKRQATTGVSLPPRRFFRARVEVAEFLRDGEISHLEACALMLLHMADWQGTGTARVQVKELARWLNVRRETASRALRHLAGLGLIELDKGRGIHLCLPACDRRGSPPHPTGGGGHPSPRAEGDRVVSREEPPNTMHNVNPPPPLLSSLSKKGPARDLSVTPEAKRVTEGSRTGGARVTETSRADGEAAPPALAAVCAHIGVETPEGVKALASLGIGPRRLLQWHKTRHENGSGIGSMVRLARTNPDQARRRAQAITLPALWLDVDVCPQCGAMWESHGHPPTRCADCGLVLRECPTCRELAPANAACPYCGALPEPYDSGGEEANDIQLEAPDDGMWARAKALLKDRLKGRDYRAWIRDAQLVQHEDTFLVLEVSDYLAKDQLRDRLDGEVRRALAEIMGVAVEELEVTYVVAPGGQVHS